MAEEKEEKEGIEWGARQLWDLSRKQEKWHR